MAAPPYSPLPPPAANWTASDGAGGLDDENLDLGIPPVSPTATVPVIASSTSNAGPMSSSAKANATQPPASPRGYGPVGRVGAASSFGSPGDAPAVSGNITGARGGGGTRPYPPAGAFGIGAESSGGTKFATDTLDEPVITTLLRDLKGIWFKLRQVLLPYGQKDILKDWDLWGPLIFCLSLAIILSSITSIDQSSTVFTGIFVIVWVGSAVVTLNSKLLGGKVSFFQSVCVLGYCIFPLAVAAFLSLFFRGVFLLRLIFCLVGFTWSTYASNGFLASRHLDDRRTLAVYPIFLFYFAIGWIVLVA